MRGGGGMKGLDWFMLVILYVFLQEMRDIRRGK